MTLKQARKNIAELVEKQRQFVRRIIESEGRDGDWVRERAVLFGLEKAWQAIEETKTEAT